MRNIRERKGRKGSEWLNKEIRRIFENLKECFFRWRRTGSKENLEYYRRLKRVVKKMMREAKPKSEEGWNASITENFKEIKKQVSKRVRKEESQRVSTMRKVREEEEAEGRWREYSGQLLSREIRIQARVEVGGGKVKG